jgi:hypothetical protein
MQGRDIPGLASRLSPAIRWGRAFSSARGPPLSQRCYVDGTTTGLMANETSRHKTELLATRRKGEERTRQFGQVDLLQFVFLPLHMVDAKIAVAATSYS